MIENKVKESGTPWGLAVREQNGNLALCGILKYSKEKVCLTIISLSRTIPHSFNLLINT